MKLFVCAILAALSVARVAQAQDAAQNGPRDQYETVAWCGVDDWVSIDAADNVRVPRRMGKVTIKNNPRRGKTKTFTKVEVINKTRPQRPFRDTVFPSHVHNAPCSYLNGGSHWLKNKASGIDDPTNAVFNMLSVRNRGAYVQGSVFSDFKLNRWEWRKEMWSYVIHLPDNDRILCCDLSVKNGRPGDFVPPV